MEKEFVTYEQALALKELGFDWGTYEHYDSHTKEICDIMKHVRAPLKQQVFRWFRENHGWIGGIRQLSQSGNGMIIGEFRKDEDNSFMMFAETYEQCENYCIENLIKMIKPQDNG